MVEEYVREQRAWLGQLYPKHGDRFVVPPTERIIDPQSPQWHIVQILQDLLESGIGGEEAAQRLADVILPSKDTEILYDNLWGCFFNAVESFSDVQTLTILSDLLASLASPPNAVNDEAIEQKTMQADPSIVATSLARTRNLSLPQRAPQNRRTEMEKHKLLPRNPHPRPRHHLPDSFW